ncbi:MAG: hormogonium polysaccharide biosynthesis glycosyltransferase HpsE [Cyanobacteria bacterium J06632_22]
MFDFSVVICTYNGVKRLPLLLERLRSQRATLFTWEILIVDNNSQDATARWVHQQQQSWTGEVPLRYAYEPRQGLAYARRRAIQQARSELVGFLDDDTLPDPYWVHEACRFAQAHPDVGAYGSEIKGVYAVPPPPGFDRIASCLAVIQRGNEPFHYGATGVLPAGAGMVVRRRAWQRCVPAHPVLTGVCGSSLKAKGEDVETLSYLRDAGWPIWHNPQMRLTHQIPAARLAPAYLLNLFRCVGLSRYPLRQLRYRPWQRPVMLGLHGLNDLRKLLRHVIQTRQLAPTDVVTACERTLLVHSLMSPVHGLRSQLTPPKTTPANSVSADSVPYVS